MPPEGEPSFEATREFGNLDVSVSHNPAVGNVEGGGLHERSQRHRHNEGKVEDISSSPSFHPERDQIEANEAPMGSMGEEIQPIAEPSAGRPQQPIVEVGAQRPGTNRRLENLHLGETREQRSQRWSRFEDLLRKNRVDIEAKCSQCAPAKDRKVG